MNNILSSRDDISIVFCGEAGQGIDTAAEILSKIFRRNNYNIFSIAEYMSRIRGGTNSTEIRVSSKRVKSYVNRIDILVVLAPSAIDHLKDRITPDTVVISEENNVREEFRYIHKIMYVPFSEWAIALGNKVYVNSIAIGTVCGLFRLDGPVMDGVIRDTFVGKPEEIIQKNIEAMRKGYKEGEDLISCIQVDVRLKPDVSTKDEIVLAGTESVALGCIAGGCNFISSYPMSPGTGLITSLAKYSRYFDIIVEQAEDEISAINTGIGAWYAGARAVVSTAGGGFALMEEGVSLAGMIESPIVIHLAQRPGPATGLPTRTEQGDLELALYSGHGEFPRIIFAPGSLEDCFYLSEKAFVLADKYQIPVFILTDQYLVDSYYNIPAFNVNTAKVQQHIVETAKDYKRYAFTETGISPRGIPGYGEGLVVVDSDEHDEEGHITENLDIRKKMVEKRLQKLRLIREEVIPPELIGNSDYKILIIAWGSNRNVIEEAMSLINDNSISLLHFKQVYPVYPDIDRYLSKAQKLIIVENNATGQFAKLLKLSAGIDIANRILKYNGIPFSVEEITQSIRGLMEV